MTPAERTCRASDLRVYKDGRAWHPNFQTDWQYVTRVELVNKSSSPCTIGGWVGVTLLQYHYVCPTQSPHSPPNFSPCPHDQVRTVPEHITRTDRGPIRIYLVKPTQFAVFSVLWGSADEDCGYLSPFPSAAEFRVPGDNQPIVEPDPTICDCGGLDMAVTAIGYDVADPREF